MKKCQATGISITIFFMTLSTALSAETWQNNRLKVDADKADIVVDEGTYTRGLSINQDDITSEQASSKLQLSAAQQHEAEVWDLTPEQEQRYIFLMQNRSGLQYQDRHLSPVWILGLNAQTDEERNRYARLAAEQEQQYIAQNLAWNNAYTDIYRELTAGTPVVKPFDFSKYSPVTHQNIVWQNSDVINLFIKSDDAVGAIMSNLMVALTKKQSMKLNVFFVGNPATKVIQAWANQQSLPPQWVASGRITLNQGDSQYKQLTPSNTKTPLLILIRQGQAQAIDTGVL